MCDRILVMREGGSTASCARTSTARKGSALSMTGRANTNDIGEAA